MGILDSIIVTKPRAPRITLYGDPGIGKTTLASKFPDALFLLTEDAECAGITATPVLTRFVDVWKAIKELLEAPDLHYKTIVLDSISKLDNLVITHIMENEPVGKNGEKPSTIKSACGGYGAGYDKAQMMHRALKMQMDGFKDKGIAVIYIAHLATATHRAPDKEDYDYYTITMNHDKSRAVYVDDVDMVGFCKLQSFTKETDSGRNIIVSSDNHVLITGISDGHVSKSRYAMPTELPMDFDQIAKYIPFYNLGAQE